jgi:hypothetical protein
MAKKAKSPSKKSGFVPDSPGKGTSTKRDGAKSTKGGTSAKKK